MLLNAAEMQFITDELFVGNKLASAEIVSSDGTRIDLRNIRSPIVVFCSKADNITPPPQALDWILDLYDSVDAIRAHGQTIVYAVHESIGHLGIFVSGSVAKKEHDEFASNIDMIDALPPGLYEAVMTPKNPNDPTADLISGDYLVRFEARTLDDIRAFGGNNEEDDREVRRRCPGVRDQSRPLSHVRSALDPDVGKRRRRRMDAPVSSACACSTRCFRLPIRSCGLSCQISNGRGKTVISFRRTTPSGKPRSGSVDWIETSLDAYRDVRDNTSEALFHAIYGSPLVQALVGLKASDENPRQQARPGRRASGPGRATD